MRGYFSISLLFFLFIAIAILSGYKSENSSSGCNSPPEIIVSKPVENDNIENPPVSVEFTAIQNSTDFTSIDLSKVSAIIRDNMNKAIDISQYIASSCDFLKKNCSFKGEVNLSEGEYILEVRVCNTAAACETREVRFILGPPQKDIESIINRWISFITRNDFGRWLSFILTCYDRIDNDGDGYTDYDGAGEELLSDYKCEVINSIGEFKNYNEETEGLIEGAKGGKIALGNMLLDIEPNVLPEDMIIKMRRIPPAGKGLDKLWFDDEYEIGVYRLNGEEFSGGLSNIGIKVSLTFDGLEDIPSEKADVVISFYKEPWGFISQSSYGISSSVSTFINHFSKIKIKGSRKNYNNIAQKTTKPCYDKTEYISRPGPCMATGACSYGSYGLPCNTSCIAKVIDNSYDDICCNGCYPYCPAFQCPYNPLPLSHRSGACEDEWGAPLIPCERWEYISKSSDCNDMLNEVKAAFGEAELAEVKYKLRADWRYDGVTFIGEENQKSCYKISFQYEVNKYCDVIYTNWSADLTSECKKEWERFLTALQRHEAGHCNIVMEYSLFLEWELKEKQNEGLRVCVEKKYGEKEIRSTAKKQLEGIVEPLLKKHEEAQDEYDKNTEHGKMQGALLDCNKCRGKD